jgi:hypothetical protein
MTIIQIMAAASKGDLEIAPRDQGDVESNPKPAPKASIVSDNAAVTNAPAITAAHDTPDAFASQLRETSGLPE